MKKPSRLIVKILTLVTSLVVIAAMFLPTIKVTTGEEIQNITGVEFVKGTQMTQEEASAKASEILLSGEEASGDLYVSTIRWVCSTYEHATGNTLDTVTEMGTLMAGYGIMALMIIAGVFALITLLRFFFDKKGLKVLSIFVGVVMFIVSVIASILGSAWIAQTSGAGAISGSAIGAYAAIILSLASLILTCNSGPKKNKGAKFSQTAKV